MSKDKNSKQMSLLEDSPANQCQLQGKEKELMMTAISGQKCLDSSGRSNPNSLLGRMCKDLLTSKTAWYSDRCKTTWKVKVSKSNVSLFQLQASVLGTKGTESGSSDTQTTTDYLEKSTKQKMYPTPNTYDYKTNPGEDYQNWKVRAEKKKKEKGISLHFALRQAVQKEEEEKRMYPTPQRSDHLHNQSETLEAWEKRAKQKKEEKGIHLQFALRHAVQRDEREKRMYPTPNRRDYKDTINSKPNKQKHLLDQLREDQQKRMYPTPRSSGQENPETLIKRKGMKAAAQHNLTAAVKMYPTPTVGCEEGGEQSKRVERTKSGGFILRKKNKPNSTFGAKLSDAMLYLEKMYPTPTQRDWKDMAYNPITNNSNRKLLPQVALKHNEPGGKLNPSFVEFLMGFPMNWTKTEPTESKPLETQSSHRSQEK